MMKTKTILFILIVIFIFNAQKANAALSEVLGVSASNQILIIDVDRSYPEVKFMVYPDENKILIDLFGAKYSPTFMFDVPTKNIILDGIDFLQDVSLGQSAVDTQYSKVGIWLTLNNSTDYTPRVLSMQNGIIKIEFAQLTAEEKANEEKKAEAQLDSRRPASVDGEYVSMGVVDLYNEATDAYSKGDINTAEELYNQVLVQDKDFFLAKFNLANIYLDRKEYDRSKTLLTDLKDKFESFIKADQKNLLIVKNTLGILYYTNGEYEKALVEFRDIVEINKDVHEPYFNIGLIYEKLKDYKQAKNYFIKASQNKNDFVDAYYHLGVLSLLTKDKKEAAIYFKKVLDIDPYGTVGVLSKKELEKIDAKYKKNI